MATSRKAHNFLDRNAIGIISITETTNEEGYITETGIGVGTREILAVKCNTGYIGIPYPRSNGYYGIRVQNINGMWASNTEISMSVTFLRRENL